MHVTATTEKPYLDPNSEEAATSPQSTTQITHLRIERLTPQKRASIQSHLQNKRVKLTKETSTSSKKRSSEAEGASTPKRERLSPTTPKSLCKLFENLYITPS